MDKTCFVLRNELQLMETDTHSTQIEENSMESIVEWVKRCAKKGIIN